MENTEAQRQLHPKLISEEAQRVIEIAHEHGALGWKVNGAGGEGGSVTILSGRYLASQAGDDPRDRAGTTAVQAHPDLPQPVWGAGVEAGVLRVGRGEEEKVKALMICNGS